MIYYLAQLFRFAKSQVHPFQSLRQISLVYLCCVNPPCCVMGTIVGGPRIRTSVGLESEYLCVVSTSSKGSF